MAEDKTFADWVGRVVEADDSVPEQAARALAATLNLGPEARSAAGIVVDGPLPPLWHWLAFLPDAPASRLASSGEAPDPLLPPLPGRRVWAGGRLRFHGELRIGEMIHRRSEILAIAREEAPTGARTRVTLSHELSTARNLGVSEVQEFVFSETLRQTEAPAGPGAPLPAPAAWSVQLPLDPVRLFRFSAATFDAERLHYDLAYARAQGCPVLAAQDRLLAILLLEAARRRREGAWPAAVALQRMRPFYATGPLGLIAGPEDRGRQALAATDAAGVCLAAEIAWEA